MIPSLISLKYFCPRNGTLRLNSATLIPLINNFLPSEVIWFGGVGVVLFFKTLLTSSSLEAATSLGVDSSGVTASSRIDLRFVFKKEYVFLVYRWVKSFQNSGSIFSQKIQKS